MKQIRDADALCAWIVVRFGETAQVADVIRVIEDMAVDAPPAVPGHTDAYNIAEMAFHNGEIRMKEKMVDMLLGMRIGADREKHDIIQEILSRVRHL